MTSPSKSVADKSSQIERYGIEHIPEEKRHESAGREFTLWFAANLTIADYVIGVLCVNLFGLTVIQCIPVLVVGNVLGGLVVGDLTTAVSSDKADADVLLVVGGDHAVVEANSLFLRRDTPPVLSFGDQESRSFLGTVRLSEIDSVIPTLATDKFEVEEAPRLTVRIDSDSTDFPYAINEVSIFPVKSATLIEYTLMLDNELIWRDYSDGVIVATPIGSTAYAFSAGGPLIHQKANAVVVVGVNSVDVTRRPIIVPLSSEILISDIASSNRCCAIIDGVTRVPVKGEVRIGRAPKPIRFIKVKSISSSIAERAAKKIELAEELLLKMPPSSKLVIKVLQQEGPLNFNNLVKKTLLPERTARLALQLLVEKEMVKSSSVLGDARRHIYSLSDVK
ncbi:MAG: cytosine permease [Thaumarchaeota archaeon]|nr:cytosine permease [Nitrososphaerota archaeon]